MKRIVGALLVWSCPVLVAGQSLGDVARKEQERRKKNEQTGVKPQVVTDEELKKAKGELANDPEAPGMYEPAASGPSEGRPASSGGQAEPAKQGDEASWRDSKAAALAKVESARKKHEMFSQMWLVPDGSYYKDRKTGETIRSVEELQTRTAAAKAELDAAEKALADLEERAHRANVPPGWLR